MRYISLCGWELVSFVSFLLRLNSISPLWTKKGFYKSLLIFDLVNNLSFIVFHYWLFFLCPSDMEFKQTFICEVLKGLFTNFFATFMSAKFFPCVKVKVRMLNQQWFEQTQTTHTILFRSLFFLMIPVICLLVCLKIIT